MKWLAHLLTTEYTKFASNCEFGINMILSLLVMYPKLKSLWMDHKGRYFSFYAVASVTGLMFPTL